MSEIRIGKLGRRDPKSRVINDDIDFLEEDSLFITCFIEGEMYGWKLAKDFSNIEIYLRFPSLKEIK